MITVVHGGQTGVDRGAHDAALATQAYKLTGFMPDHGRDEEGLIPREVALYLVACRHQGYAARTRANLDISHALLIVVDDVRNPGKSPGTRMTLEAARHRALPRLVTDPKTDRPTVARWLQELVNRHVRQHQEPFRLMVAGPRASKWEAGRVETSGLLTAIARLLT